MLHELSVRDLGVIEELRLVLGPGMTAVTGETGAGKTLVVQAIQLLTGGKTDPTLVRTGAREAVIEGRFVFGDDEEIIVSRVIPAEGRSRAYIDGLMANASALSDAGRRLIDLHGQHTHQSLLSPAVQRAALDQHGGVNLEPLRAARKVLDEAVKNLEALGGDTRERAHEMDLLTYQINEITAAAIAHETEDADIEAEEDVLAHAQAHLEAGSLARQALTDDGGALDAIGTALAALASRRPFETIASRLRDVQGELDDLGAELRTALESIEDDPGRLELLRQRRQLLRELVRKYGDDLSDVIAFGREASDRLDQLVRHDELAQALEVEIDEARRLVAHEAKLVAEARRAASGPLAGAVGALLPELALPRAQISVEVRGDDPADDVEFMFAANSGTPSHRLAKVASGGELARVMLALRRVLTSGPETLVFDEVDAGIGGEAAIAVGSSLARLAANHQVLVVTHLPQVAAFADEQLVVTKTDDGVGAHSSIAPVRGPQRVVELARMLAGRPDSVAGQDHAAELVALGDAVRAERDAR